MKTKTRLMALLTIVVLTASCYRAGCFYKTPEPASPMTPSVAE